jgi:hypothetical protein
VRCDGLGVAVVDDEPGACGALVDGRHVHLLAVPRHDPSGAAKQYEGDGWEQRVGGNRVKQIGGSWARDPRRGRRRVYRRPRTDPITEGEVGVGRRLSGTGCSLASEVRSLTHGPEAHMSAMDGASVKETTSLSPCALLPVRSAKAGILLVTGGLGRCVHGEQTRASRASTQADNESGSPAGMCVGRGWVPAR